MRRLLLVANPAASGFTASLHRDIVEILEQSRHITAVWPNGPAQARSEAAAAAAAGFDVVAAMGGDGVVHEVANGIIGTGTALGVIPAGTTNVVRRILGLPRKPRDAAEAIAGTHAVRRLATLNFNRGLGDHREDHVVSFAAGIGLDAEVIRDSERRPLSKVGFGSVHYARSAIRIGATYGRKLPTIRVTDGSRSADAVAVLFQVHEEFTYLGRLPLTLGSGPTPMAAVVHKASVPRLLSLLARTATKRDVSRVRGVEIWKGFDEITLTADPALWTEADGELLGKADRVRVSADDRALLVVDTFS
jgi:diacylglycerol kinase family enzyme